MASPTEPQARCRLYRSNSFLATSASDQTMNSGPSSLRMYDRTSPVRSSHPNVSIIFTAGIERGTQMGNHSRVDSSACTGRMFPTRKVAVSTLPRFADCFCLPHREAIGHQNAQALALYLVLNNQREPRATSLAHRGSPPAPLSLQR